MKKEILDACCGSRAFWFDKTEERCLFIDKRQATLPRKHNDTPRSPVVVSPDIQCDFSTMPIETESFSLVVFDPPHIVKETITGNVEKYYGVLNGDWREMLRRGFSECFRVLKPEGILIFKWNEVHIKVNEILALTHEKPLFGHKSGKLSKTHWIVFMKSTDNKGLLGDPTRAEQMSLLN